MSNLSQVTLQLSRLFFPFQRIILLFQTVDVVFMIIIIWLNGVHYTEDECAVFFILDILISTVDFFGIRVLLCLYHDS